MHTKVKNIHLGKFEGNESQLEAEIVHSASLDGTCETMGDVIELGWHASLVLGNRYAWIVYEDSQGFVDVTSFNTHKEADEAFGMFRRSVPESY